MDTSSLSNGDLLRSGGVGSGIQSAAVFLFYCSPYPSENVF